VIIIELSLVEIKDVEKPDLNNTMVVNGKNNRI